MTPFAPKEIFRILAECRVDHVVIGGIAATLHGSNLRTDDTDICPSRDPENLERLAAALKRMEARIRTPDAPDGLPFACDAQFLNAKRRTSIVGRSSTSSIDNNSRLKRKSGDHDSVY